MFTKAHEAAKETRKAFETYRAAFSSALKGLYAAVKAAEKQAEKTTEQKLEDLGIEAWERDDMKRYYINEAMFEAVFGLEIDRYNSGNICSAYLNGEKISNSRAGKLIGGKKIYFDAKTQKWMQKYCMTTSELCDELRASVRV